MPSRLIHVVANSMVTLFFMILFYCVCNTMILFFIHCYIPGHVGTVSVLAVVNNAALNMRVHMSFEVSFSFPWDKYSELGLLDHGLVFLLLFFFSSLHTVSHRGCTNLHSHQQWASVFSTPSPALVILYLFGNSHSNICDVTSKLWF